MREFTPGTGNENERLTVRSGGILLIDQFMLGNEQFIDRLQKSSGTAELNQTVREFGGAHVDFPVGEYGVFRDPRQMVILVHPLGAELPPLEGVRFQGENVGRVFVDTRCVVILDRDVALNPSLLNDYLSLRKQGREKEARDLVRTQGGAVRYGFSREGDELGVYLLNESGLLGVWPDVIDEQGTQ